MCSTCFPFHQQNKREGQESVRVSRPKAGMADEGRVFFVCARGRADSFSAAPPRREAAADHKQRWSAPPIYLAVLSSARMGAESPGESWLTCGVTGFSN